MFFGISDISYALWLKRKPSTLRKYQALNSRLGSLSVVSGGSEEIKTLLCPFKIKYHDAVKVALSTAKVKISEKLALEHASLKKTSSEP